MTIVPSTRADEAGAASLGGQTYAEVALASGGPATFTYSVARHEDVRPGCLVLAPLGSRRLPGLVVRLHAREPTFPTRAMEGLLYPTPLVSSDLLGLADWLARTYRAPVWDCLTPMLPPGLSGRLAGPRGLREDRLRAWLDGLVSDGAPGGEGELSTAIPRPELTPPQERALEPLARALARGDHAVFVLHGVTGSGKTQVYLRAAEQVVAGGGQVLVLVSEIALTPEAAERFSVRFPGRVAVLHSELTPAQRDRAWAKIRSGQVSLVVGPRSAVFAPLQRLQLIVIDEEHEWTYKQEKSPRYHARAAGLARGRNASACVVLSSATPDVSTYYHALRGRFELLSLPERYAGPWTVDRGPKESAAPIPVHGPRSTVHGPPMPPVEIVDLRRELREGNRSIFSRALAAALAETFERGEQAILFLNRRGAATSATCRDCGHTLQCRSCETPFAYHRGATPRADGEAVATSNPQPPTLLCHRCNRRRAMPERCPQCSSPRIRVIGIGTQRIEQEVRALLPDARVQRWDRDAASARGAHERFWREFAERRVDVLVGTQMVAKALDVPTVTLVGAVLADSGLYLPDFRAAERTFQLLTQVAGRAGRGALAGRAIIQTYAADHYAIRAAACHDYAAFYEQEIEFRHRFGYPPLRRLAKLVYSHSNETRCWRESMQVRRALVNQVRRLDVVDVEVVGPAPCFQRRVRGRYRWQLLLFGEEPHRLLDETPLGHGWIVDVDPVNLL